MNELVDKVHKMTRLLIGYCYNRKYDVTMVHDIVQWWLNHEEEAKVMVREHLQLFDENSDEQ